MSVESLTIVLNHSQAKGTDKLVLIGIANHDGDGGAWPSIESLARYANCTERSVQRSIRRLVDLGEVAVETNGGGVLKADPRYRPNRYVIRVECPPACDRSANHRIKSGPPPSTSAPTPKSGVHRDLPRGDKGGISGVTPTSPLADSGVTSVASRGDAGVVSGVTPTSPEPSKEPSKQPPPNQRASPTRHPRLVVVDSDDPSKPPDRPPGDRAERATARRSRSLASEVRAALPTGLARSVAAGPLTRACRPLADAGVEPKSLGALAKVRPWSGAGPGAVIAWLRDDAAAELADATARRESGAGRSAVRDFAVWCKSQPECPHGLAGGGLDRPGIGTATCASCRAERGQGHRKLAGAM